MYHDSFGLLPSAKYSCLAYNFTGPDEIPTEMYKNAHPQLADEFLKFVEFAWDQSGRSSY